MFKIYFKVHSELEPQHEKSVKNRQTTGFNGFKIE